MRRLNQLLVFVFGMTLVRLVLGEYGGPGAGFGDQTLAVRILIASGVLMVVIFMLRAARGEFGASPVDANVDSAATAATPADADASADAAR